MSCFFLDIILQRKELKLIQMVLDAMLFQNTIFTCYGIAHGLKKCGFKQLCGQCYLDSKETTFFELWGWVAMNDTGDDLGSFAMTAWSIWLHRNQLVFEGRMEQKEDIINRQVSCGLGS